MLIETSDKESLGIISFRGSSKDKDLMRGLAEMLNCKPSAVIRIGLRVLHELSMTKVLPEVMHRVHVNKVLLAGKNVLRLED